MSEHAYNRLKLMVSSGTVDRHGNGKAQVSVLDEEVLGNIKMVVPYGFAHHPKGGSQAHMVFPGGDRSYGVALVVSDSSHAPDLAEGEAALYDDKGSYVVLKQDGSLVVHGASKVVIESGVVELSGDIKITGNVSVTGNITATGTIKGA
jgi:phage baseplate assembly protein V